MLRGMLVAEAFDRAMGTGDAHAPPVGGFDRYEHRAEPRTWSGPGRLRRGITLGLLSTALALGGCSRDIRCSDPAVVDAYRRALDQLYAEFRQVTEVSLDVRDLVAVDQSRRRSVCKAVTRVTITTFGTSQHEDAVVTFVAEATEKGDVVVTVSTPGKPAQ